MAGKAAAGKLWQANMIKTIQEMVDKMNKRERQEATHRPKIEKLMRNNNNGVIELKRGKSVCHAK